MPAMEVVIAGAQYHARSDSAASVNRHGRRTGDHDECLRLLHASGVSVDAEDVAGFTAFMRASQTRHSRLDLAQVLLELGADVNHRSRFGGVAMHEAIMAQDRTAVAFLSRNGASMDVRDNDGVSPRDIVSLVLGETPDGVLQAISSDLTADSEEAEEGGADVIQFHPAFTYPIYGEHERIFGYKGLQLNLSYAAGSLATFFEVQYAKRIEQMESTLAVALKADDVDAPMRSVLASQVCATREQFAQQ
ncbi:hypothetical protein IWW51_006100, partial [Coemansia sp. RSA 2702]